MCNVPSELSGTRDRASAEPPALQEAKCVSGFSSVCRGADMVACLGVFQANDVSLRNSQYLVIDVLAEEMWSNWSDPFQRTEDRFDL